MDWANSKQLLNYCVNKNEHLTHNCVWVNSRWGETNIKGILTEGTAEVQRKITLLSLYDFLYMCFVLILYLFEKT